MGEGIWEDTYNSLIIPEIQQYEELDDIFYNRPISPLYDTFID
jgi:hypothetical protein